MPTPAWIRDSRVATAAAAVLIGAIAGVFLVSWWARSEAGFTIEILGSGDRVSVLITHQHRHVLIASGNDGPEFTNALSQAFSPIGRDIELVLIDGEASADIVEKVRAIDSRQVLFLAPTDQIGVPTVEDSMTIPFADGDVLTITLGQDGGWTGTLTVAGENVITISPPAVHDVDFVAPVLISIDGQIPPGAGFAAVVGPAGELNEGTAAIIPVAAGQSLKIDLTGSELRIPTE
jgi:hypothetical protein